jgi:hypothetical protein
MRSLSQAITLAFLSLPIGTTSTPLTYFETQKIDPEFPDLICGLDERSKSIMPEWPTLIFGIDVYALTCLSVRFVKPIA